MNNLLKDINFIQHINLFSILLTYLCIQLHSILLKIKFKNISRFI